MSNDNITPLREQKLWLQSFLGTIQKSYLLHVTREFHSLKLICRNLYAIFSHVKKAYTASQNGVQLFSHVDV